MGLKHSLRGEEASIQLTRALIAGSEEIWRRKKLGWPRFLNDLDGWYARCNTIHQYLTPRRGEFMKDAGWKKLCREIMDEQDPERLFALADALNRVLEPAGVNPNKAGEELESVSVC